MLMRFFVKSARSKMADEGIKLPVCSSFKSVPAIPQFMINNVLAVCPDVDRKDVVKDLVITGSATRTINRILDGQFPAAVDIDVENTLSDLSSEEEARNTVDSSNSKKLSMSVNIAMPTNSQDGNDSSDKEKYSDMDDDDDIMILQEERKSLFSALKKRIHTEESEQSCTEQSEPLELCKDRGIVYCKEVDTGRKKKPVKIKKSRTIVDLSFLDDDDDDDDDDDLHVKNKTGCKISKLASSEPVVVNKAADCFLLEPHHIKNTCNTAVSKPENFSKQGEKLTDSPLQVSDHDTDSCEDSDDFPCIVACRSSSHSETTSQSCTPNLSSGSCPDSQDSSEVPAKRKKRSKEEILSQRNEALLKKRAKELEQKAKKEAKEREKQARQQAKEQMKTQKDREKLLKKADSMNQKLNNRLDGCIKQILVCIDPEILTNGQLPEESLLLQKLETLGASHKLESQLIPASITWQRAVVEHDVAQTLQISTKTTFVDENHALVRLSADKFIEMVFHFREEMQNPAISVIADDETLTSFCERTVKIYPEKVITLVIMGLEKYFRDVKLTKTRQFRTAVVGSSSSDNVKPSGKGRKKANKGLGPSIIVSRVDVEEALVDLQLRQPNCRVRMCETEEEFAELLTMFTKAVAEAPFKKKQPETFSFCVEGGEKASVKVSKEGQGLKKVWQQQFQQFRNVSADMAAAIASSYPSPQSLLQAYKRCDSREEAAKLLKDILVRRGAGVLGTSRKIGPNLSRQVYLFLTSTDGDLSVK